MPKVIVFEGPAGSGKTTALKAVMESEELSGKVATAELLPTFDRPRSYEGRDGVLLSQMKDYRTTLQLLSHVGPEAVIVDRWYISQWVYGTIRRNEYDLNYYQGLWLIQNAFLTYEQAARELLTREWPTKPVLTTPLDILFVFMLPDTPVLNYLRSHADREFPYSPENECWMYGKAAKIVCDVKALNISCVKVRTETVTSLGLINPRLIRRIRDWYDGYLSPVS